MRKEYLFFLAFHWIIVQPGFSQSASFSLAEAIQYANNNHLDIKNDLLNIEDAKSNIKEFTSIGMPKLTGNLDYQHFIDLPTSILPQGSFFEGDPDQNIPPNPPEDLKVQFGVKNNITAGLNLDILLFDGSFFVGLRAARVFKEVVAQQADITKENLGINVAKAYLGVVVAMRNQEIVTKNIQNLEKLLYETEVTFQNGFVEKLDVDRLELSLANLLVEHEKITSLIEISKNVLKFSMGYPMEQAITVTETLDDLMITDYEKTTFSNVDPVYDERADYRTLIQTNDLLGLNIKQLKFQYIPTIRAFGSYSQVLQGNQINSGVWFPTTIVGLSLNLPIFDGFEKSAKIQRAKIAVDQNALTIQNLERAIDMEVNNAKLAFRNALKSVNTTLNNQNLAQKIYDTTLIKYREGVGSSLEVNQAERELYTAQGNHINALYDLLIAKVDMEKALGKF